MRFILQIALSDAAAHVGSALPSSGLLSIFVGERAQRPATGNGSGSSTLLGHPWGCETDPCVAACFAEASLDPNLYTYDEATLQAVIADLEATRDGKPPNALYRWEDAARQERGRAALEALRDDGPRRTALVHAAEDWVQLVDVDSHMEAHLCFWDTWSVQMSIRRGVAQLRLDRTRAKLSRA